MNDKEAAQYWNESAEAWTMLARQGFDIYRDYLNTPAFFAILPNIEGLYGIDIGCGEGYNTRLLTERGAIIEAIDIAGIFIQKAIEEQSRYSFNINYQVASATDLPFEEKKFDFATAFMSFMDIAETEKVLKEAFRVLKPNGFLQFSITHPCFNTPHRKNLRDFSGSTIAIEVGEYFKNLNGEIDEWIFGAAPAGLTQSLRKFRIPKFSRTLTQWINAVISAGFIIEQLNEPFPDNETIKKEPRLQDSQVVAYFLHIRCRRPS
jgi:ubiquinone/menaquinone biosynthesis C-methylase UbiE